MGDSPDQTQKQERPDQFTFPSVIKQRAFIGIPTLRIIILWQKEQQKAIV